jgi:hypothetical protein
MPPPPRDADADAPRGTRGAGWAKDPYLRRLLPAFLVCQQIFRRLFADLG